MGFTSRKLEQELKVKEAKPLIINQQCVDINFNVTFVMKVM